MAWSIHASFDDVPVLASWIALNRIAWVINGSFPRSATALMSGAFFLTVAKCYHEHTKTHKRRAY